MSCGVPSIKTLYIIIVFFIYLLFVLSFSTFQKKNVLGGGWFKTTWPTHPLSKKLTIPPPPKHPFSSYFFYKLFSFTFQKKNISFFFLGGGGTTWPTHPLSKKIHNTRPPPTSNFILFFFLNSFPSLFKKKKKKFFLKTLQLHKIITHAPPPQHPFLSSFFFFLSLLFHFSNFFFFLNIFYMGVGYTTWPTHPLPKRNSQSPPSPPNIHFYLLFLSSIPFPSLFKKNIYIFFLGGGSFTTWPTHPSQKITIA